MKYKYWNRAFWYTGYYVSYIKNKSSIKITKVTLWYGFSESLGIYQGHKKLHETYTGNSTTSDLEEYVGVENNE